MKVLNDYRNEIDKALASTLEEYTTPPELYAPVRYVLEAKGKRIRPILVLLAAEVVGGERKHAIHAALATELLHNFTLVHDDIMDRSALRRGRATVHTHFGENAAILSGDVMMGMAMRLAALSANHAKNPVAVHDVFAKGFIDVCQGQALDMAFTKRLDVQTDEYFHMIEQKTARLLEMCVCIGAMIGNGSEQQIEALRTFARNIGVAFQMQDDLLDLDGSDEFGKTQGGDIIEGKRTWLVLRARDLCSQFPDCEPVLNEFFANNGLHAERVPAMKQCLESMGVLHEARSIVRSLTDDAFVHLDLLPNNDARYNLKELARLLMGRLT